MSLFPFTSVDSIRAAYDVDEIYDFINSGTFASVFRGVRKNVGTSVGGLFAMPTLEAGRVVALKVMDKSNIKSEKDARDIINEAAMLKCAHHPNIVKLLDVFQTSREVCLVLEFVEGKELLQGISQSRVFSEARAKNILSQMLSALRYLHEEKRIVHRDLKPENIILDSDDKVTIVDFGLAKFFGHQRRMLRSRTFVPKSSFLFATEPESHFNSSQTSSSGGLARSASLESVDSVTSHTNSPILATPCGTLKYAAPETVRTLASHGVQFSTTRGSMPKLDMYSLGIVVYIMLCGKLPYDTRNKLSLASQMEKGPTFAEPKWASISDEGRDFVGRLMAPDPGQRMSAGDALAHPWLKHNDDESTGASSLSLVSVGGGGSVQPVSPGRGGNEDEGDRKKLSDAFRVLMPSLDESAGVETFSEISTVTGGNEAGVHGSRGALSTDHDLTPVIQSSGHQNSALSYFF